MVQRTDTPPYKHGYIKCTGYMKHICYAMSSRVLYREHDYLMPAQNWLMVCMLSTGKHVRAYLPYNLMFRVDPLQFLKLSR
jgi:hypothetical protein